MNEADWNATVAAHANSGTPKYQGAPGMADVMAGADVLMLAKAANAYNTPATVTGVFSAARIDGVGLANGGGNPGAGGVQLQAFVKSIQITNDIFRTNSGGYAGAIGLGQPGQADADNIRATIRYNRVIGNGSPGTLPGAVEAGGIGLFGGSSNYVLADNLICSNHTGEPDSLGFGGGILHYGRSAGGAITRNRVVYNSSIESGGGIAIKQREGTTYAGAVAITDNIVQTNLAGNDGGGLLVDGALNAAVTVQNNMINANVASDIGGAIMLHDSINVRIDDDTVANNTATGAPVIGSPSTTPHSAGLASTAIARWPKACCPAARRTTPGRTGCGTPSSGRTSGSRWMSSSRCRH